jgi:hypothetical protein
MDGCYTGVGEGGCESAYTEPGVVSKYECCDYRNIEENSREGAVVALVAFLVSIA